MNYNIEFTKEIKVSAKNEGEAMYKAIKELEKLIFEYKVQATFDLDIEEY
jgi:hypothetical protein